MIISKKNVHIAKNVQISGIPLKFGVPDIHIILKNGVSYMPRNEVMLFIIFLGDSISSTGRAALLL